MKNSTMKNSIMKKNAINKGSIKKWSLILIGLLIVTGLVFFTMREPEQLVAHAQVIQAPITQTLNIEGKTRLKQRYQISAPVSGELSRVSLKVGDTVQQGQVVAYITPNTAALLDSRSHSQAQAAVTAAQASLHSAQQHTSAAKASATLAEQNLTRLQPLLHKQAISRQQYDQALAEQQRSQATYAATRSDEAVAQANLDAARAQLNNVANVANSKETNRTQSNALAIRAPIDGQLICLDIDSAQPITAGTPIMDIGDLTDMEITADALSADASLLKADMQAQVLGWGGKPLSAVIRRVNPSGYTKVSALGVEEQRTDVIFDITSPYEDWQNLGDGYRVDLEVKLHSVADALQIPIGALFRDDNGWAVYRIKDGSAQLTPVEVGIKSNSHVQITKGLEKGDNVIIQPDTTIKQGTRVRGE